MYMYVYLQFSKRYSEMTSYAALFVVSLLILGKTHPPATEGHKLLLIPQNINSHVFMFGRMAVALVQEEHQAVMLLSSNMRVPEWLHNSGVIIVRYTVPNLVPVSYMDVVSEMFLRMRFATSKLEYMRLWSEIDRLVAEEMRNECFGLLRDTDLRKKMAEMNFDLAVSDSIGLPCVMNYPLLLDLPFTTFSIPGFSFVTRNPDLPSFVPNMMLGQLTDSMTFWQRVENTMGVIMAVVMWNRTNMADHREFPELEKYHVMDSIVQETLFWFVLEDMSLAYPRPYMPNAAPIGDLMVSPAQPMPEEYAKFMDNSPEGVVLVSFGSYFDFVPDDILAKFCTAFGRIKQKVIWKLKDSSPCQGVLPEDVSNDKLMVVRWMPQNDLLGHPNLNLFITHGGLNSALEAVYHAKPMLVFAIALDQPFNAKLIETKGYGRSMDITSFTPDRLEGAITSVLGDSHVAKSLKKGSLLLRDKPQPASKRIAFWVDHVIKYGGKHMQSGALKLSMWELYMLDVYLLGTLVCSGLLVVTIGCMNCILRLPKRCCRRGKPKAD